MTVAGVTEAAAANSNNRLAILAIIAGIAVTVANDVLIKLAGATTPLGEMLFIRGAMCTIALTALAAFMGHLRPIRTVLTVPVALRVTGEVVGTFCYLYAILNMPLGLANAIFQITPLLVTAGAALFLGEQVGWRRWTATAIGFLGSLLIIQPGTASFNAYALLIVACAAFVALRDLATRAISKQVPSLMLAVVSAAAVMIMGLLLGLGERWHWPSNMEWLLIAGAASLLSVGYLLMTVAVRIGEISVVSPFRYTVVLFGLLAGWLVWAEVPNLLAFAGLAIVVLAGLYTLLREQQRATS